MKNKDVLAVSKNSLNKNMFTIIQAFRIASDISGDLMFIFDTENQSIITGDSVADKFGILPEQDGIPYEIVKSDIVVEGYKEEFVALHEKIINGEKSAKGKIGLKNTNGQIRIYELIFSAIMNEDGTPSKKAVGIYKDITNFEIQFSEQKKIIEKTSQREYHLETKTHHQDNIIKTFANLFFAVWLVDLEKNTIEEVLVPDFARSFTEGNNNCENQKVLDDIANKFVSKAFKKEMNDFLNLSTLLVRLQDKQFISYEYKSNINGWCRANFVPVYVDENNEVSQVIFAIQHIDSEKAHDEQTKLALKEAYESSIRANRAKTVFLSNMSHDIRTPMNAIIGMTAIASVHLDDKERVKDCLHKITIASKHLLGLINEVLDMSKIESGRVDLQNEEFNLSELIEALVTMSRPQMLEKNHNFLISVHNITHEKVVGDIQRLQQALMNLISNAIKYTPDGGNIKFSVSEKTTNKKKIGCYEFVLEDNGIGMDEDYLIHLFEPFTRADDERISKIQGTGLGMSIARNIVQMMNGFIKVESELNKGSRFTATVFLELQDVDVNAKIEEFADLPILVVDDDENSCETTCEILKELGMNGEYVLNGKSAIEKIELHHTIQQDYFAVIVDWQMPEMNGVEVTREIRKCFGENIPIIIISAYDWSEIEVEARTAGANAFILKPLFKSRVIELFKRLVGSFDDYDDKDLFALDDFSENSFAEKRVLLVDDNDMNAEITSEILKMAHLEVEVARNGKEALDMVVECGENYYDLIFMDVQMPIMNGYEATSAIRALSGEYPKRIPIIAMTANAFSDDVVAAKNAGMNEHVSKPLKFDVLLKTLKRWL